MWSTLLRAISSMVIAYLVYYVLKWLNPKCKAGAGLPPGSMGLPLIGETLHLFFPSNSLDVHMFFKNRIQKHGPLFKTNIAGQPVVVSSDPKVNHCPFLQEGKPVQFCFILNHSGEESIKEKLLSQLEELIYRNLGSWSKHDSVELKRAFSMMVCKFTSRQLFGRDAERLRQSTAEKLTNFIQVLMSFPLNIPGTRFHKCLEEKIEVTSTLREIVKEKQASHDDKMHEGDILSQFVKDMKTEKFAQEDFVVKILFSTLFATTETNSSIISLALKLLSENPSAIEQLQVEHEEILRNRPKSSSSVTWDEYKSMTFTLQDHIINSLFPSLLFILNYFRKQLKVEALYSLLGYTIPAGWGIMIASSAQHLNTGVFRDPLAFNPWRWKVLLQFLPFYFVTTMNFMPFGRGVRQCAGAEFSKALLSIFFIIYWSPYYRWKPVKASNITRTPLLNFGDGIHIKASKK
ncbi:unnamed protein product [Coffea canephora]|uniref:Cytochrome P450 n=1 Tax=Coffea canephora TaxID=49390 RepID=A0A068V6Y8_COFCA|nr:unnamed protein product [Coffea canephora]